MYKSNAKPIIYICKNPLAILSISSGYWGDNCCYRHLKMAVKERAGEGDGAIGRRGVRCGGCRVIRT
jgi:hypothetical protein